MMRPLPLAALTALVTLPAAAQQPTATPRATTFPGRPVTTCVSAQATESRLNSSLGSGSQPPILSVRSTLGADGTQTFFEPAPIDPAGVLIDELAYFQVSLTPIPDDSHEMLDRWEAASRSHLPVPDAERLRFRYADPSRSEHETVLTCELQGPIRADELARRYDWTVTDDTDAVELTAVPKDRLERLFYDRFTVTLSAATWRPTSVRFVKVGAEAGPTVALRPWIDADPSIELVAYESDAPIAERLIRTADLSDEPPRLLRDDAPLSLPPAPLPPDVYYSSSPLTPVEAPKPTPPGEPAALRDVLEKFDRNYASADRVRLELFRWEYDGVFGVEKRSRVEIWLEDHDHGWFESRPVERSAGPASAGYALKDDHPEGWDWHGETVAMYDSGTLVHNDALRVPADLGDGGSWGDVLCRPIFALPVWADGSAVALRERFDLKFIPTTDKEVVHVSGTPRTRADASNFARVDIVFDRQTGRPQATRMFDPTGNGSIVLAVRSIELDGPRPPVKALKPNPYRIPNPAPVVTGAAPLAEPSPFAGRLWLLSRLCFRWFFG